VSALALGWAQVPVPEQALGLVLAPDSAPERVPVTVRVPAKASVRGQGSGWVPARVSERVRVPVSARETEVVPVPAP